MTAHGFQDATRDADRIRTLLAAGSEPNYGLVCPDGVFAWDVDGEDWPARLHGLTERYGDLPPTLRTETAHGEHQFWRWPDAVGPRPLGEMFGFVTRWGSSGRAAGYVIGPRSVHQSGAVYAPAAGSTFEIATLPETWAEAALAPEPSPVITISEGYRIPERVAEGARYDAIVSYTAHLYNRGMAPDEMWPLVRDLLAPRFVMPLPEAGLRARFERAVDGMSRRLGEPRALPEGQRQERETSDELEMLGHAPAGGFPADPDPAAFAGLLGEIVEDIAPGTDASLVGLLGSLLAFAGALIPGQSYFHRIQTSSPYIALVGESSVGRKGTAMIRAHDAMASAIEPVYVNRVVLDGLNSGEGLVSALHYKREAFPHEPTVGLVFEEEYASLLASRQREGSTLDPKLRQAFDGGPISNRRSGETKMVLPPYWLPALIAITPHELRSRLEGGALRSGSANRWLYVAVVKRQGLPTNDEPVLSPEHARDLVKARRAAIEKPQSLDVAPAVTRTLAEYSDWLPTVSHGIALELSRRLGIIAFRVALVHALVERSEIVGMEHLRRGIALAEYGRAGIPWVFGEMVGSPDADLLLRNLVAAGRLTKRAITQQIIRDPLRRQAAIDELVHYGRAAVITVQPERGGRPRTELVATGQTGEFRAFRAMFSDSASENAENLHGMHETPDLSTNDPAQNLHETRTELHETHETLACRDYSAHQSSHRYTATGWVCDACAD